MVLYNVTTGAEQLVISFDLQAAILGHSCGQSRGLVQRFGH